MGKMKTSFKELILLCFSLPSELPQILCCRKHLGLSGCQLISHNKPGQACCISNGLRAVSTKAFFSDASVFFQFIPMVAPHFLQAGRRQLKNIQLWEKRCARHGHFLLSCPITVEEGRDKYHTVATVTILEPGFLQPPNLWYSARCFLAHKIS